MSSSRIRRPLIALLTAALALGAFPAASSSEPPGVEVREVPLGLRVPMRSGPGAFRTSPLEVCSPGPATMVGLAWEQEGDEAVSVRLSWRGERPGRVRLLGDPEHAADPGTAEAGDALEGTDPVWTGGARCVRVALAVPAGVGLSGARAVFVDTDPEPSLTDRVWGVVGTAFGASAASAVARQPAIVTREGWGADEDIRRCSPDYADAVRMAYVHHTAGTNAYTRRQADDIVRGIYAYHVQGRRFCDIAYNFLVDRFGTVYEGRYGGMTEPVIGAHAQGFNTGSTGVAAMGDFTRRAPTKKTLRSLKRVLAWRLDAAHVDPTATAVMTSAGGSNQKYDEGEEVTLPAISGHRDTGYTSCPGNRLYGKLNTLRRGARRIGLPKIWDVSASSDEVRYGETPVQFLARLSGTLEWAVTITDELGSPVRTYTGLGSAVSATWDGTDATGLPAPEGTYTVTISARNADRAKNALPATMSVLVLGPEP